MQHGILPTQKELWAAHRIPGKGFAPALCDRNDMNSLLLISMVKTNSAACWKDTGLQLSKEDALNFAKISSETTQRLQQIEPCQTEIASVCHTRPVGFFWNLATFLPPRTPSSGCVN